MNFISFVKIQGEKDQCGMLVLFNTENTTEGPLFRAEQYEDKNF